MKNTGITRRVDELGRIVIPMELRRTLNIEPGDPMEIFVDGDRIILRKYQPGCIFCNEVSDLVQYAGKHVCRKCVGNLDAE